MRHDPGRRLGQRRGRHRARRDGGPGLTPRVAGLRRGRVERPGGRLGHPLRGGHRLRGHDQDLRHLRRGAQPHEDRRLRRGLGVGRRVAPTRRRGRRGSRQHRPDPELREHLPVPQGPVVELGRRGALRRAARLRREPPHVQHGGLPDGAHLVGRRVRQVGRLRRQGDRVRLPDLHRGCRGLPHGAQPRARHREPVLPRRGAARCRRRPAEAAAREHRRVLVGLPQGDPGLHDRRHRRRHELAGHPERARGRGGDDPGRAPRRGHHGMVGHLDDLVRVEEPELRVRVARLHREPRGERGGDVVLRRGAVERRRPASSARTARRTTPATRTTRRRSGTGRRPIEECLDGRTDVQCTDYAAWTEAWQEIKG